MLDQTLPKPEATAIPRAEPVADMAAPRPTASTDWAAIERDPEFQELVREKRAFIIPATIFFVAYYFALPILVGYFPAFMSTRVVGYINLAYLFALSQFVMAWVLMALYVRRAGAFDALAGRIAARVKGMAR